MVKFTLIPLMFALLSVSNANAATMTIQERVAVARKLERAAPFVQEKYLPASFVKEVEKSLSSKEDRARFKKLNADWSKHYSKKVKTRVTGNSFHVTYMGAPLISVKIAALKPFTVQINKSKEAVISKENYFADMSAAMKAAGYDISAGKKSAWYQLLPEAYAEGELEPRTVENSVFLLGMSTFGLNEDGSLKTAMDITAKRADWKSALADGKLESINCSGDNMTGKFKSNGSEVDFFMSRQDGLKMTIDGINIKGDIKRNDVTEYCRYVEGKAKPAKALSSNDKIEIRKKHTLVCKALKALRPAAGLNCNQDESALEEHFKSECAEMAKIGLSADFQLEACTNPECTAFTKIPDTQGSFAIDSIADLHGYMKFQNDVKAMTSSIEKAFTQEIAAGQIKREGNTFKIEPPDKMGARRAQQFMNAINQIPTVPTPQAGRSDEKFRELAVGIAGLLDCCYDTKCKVDLLQKSNVELVPAESVN